jgi:glutathione S-transferase
LWIRRLDDEIHPAGGALTFASTAAQRRARLEQQGLSVEAYLANVPDESRRKRQEEAISKGVSAPAAQQAILTFRKLFEDMNTALKKNGRLVAGQTTLADLSYVPYVLRIINLGLDKRLNMPASVMSWFKEFEGRPSYATAILKWNDPKADAALREASENAWRIS